MKPFGFAITLGALILGLFPTSSAARLQSQSGSIEGTVVHSGSNEPIPNVQITVATGNVDSLAFQALRIAGQNAGAFVRPNTAEGDAGLLLSLTENATSQGMSALSPDLVTAMNNFRDQTAKFKAITDNRGQFRIHDVPAGQYSLRAARDGYFGSTMTTVTVGASQAASVSFSMLPGAIVGGRVVGDGGEPLAGADVSAYAVVYQAGMRLLLPAVTAKTNFRGEYRLFWLMPGEYYVGVTDPEQVGEENQAVTLAPNTADVAQAKALRVKPGDSVDGVDIELRQARRFRIVGTVTSSLPVDAAGNPPRIRSVMVTLVPRDSNTPVIGEPITTGASLGGPESGKFQLTASPGTYELFAYVFGGPETPNGPSLMGGFGQTSVDLADRDAAVTVNVAPEVKVAGTLTIDGGPPQGRFQVLLIPEKTTGLQMRPASTDTQGAFVASAFAGTRVRPLISGLPSSVYVAEVRKDGANVFDTGFEPSAQSDTSIQVLLVSGAGTVQGTVRDGARRPVASAAVVLVPAEPRRQNRAAFKISRANVNGKFSMAGVPPGDYKILAWESLAGDDYVDPRFLAKYENGGVSIAVGKSATVTADLTAIPVGQ